MAKVWKRAGAGLLLLLGLGMLALLLFEAVGMCVNHITTEQQTSRLRSDLEQEIPDIEILDVVSQTGNTTGTGNHVDCLSMIVFSTQMQEPELIDAMSNYYELDGWSCCIQKMEDGNYLFYLNTSAPFWDNIEGH